MLKIDTKKKLFFRGQALLTLLFFAIIGITVTSAAVVMILVNSLSGTKQQQGEIAYEIAQSGMDEALIRFLRNPDYTGTGILPLNVGDGTADITRSGSGPSYTFTSTGKLGLFTRKVQATVSYQDNVLRITGRKEVYN